MLYEPLCLYNSKTDEVVPFVASSYEWLEPTKLTTKLQPAAKFSDGEALDSNDVRYTLEVSSRYNLLWTIYMDAIESIETPDAQTVVLNFKTENFCAKNALEMLVRMPILPEHVWTKIEQEKGNDATEMSVYFNDNPVGSGAYKVDFYDEQQIRCVRDDNWWGKGVFGLPKPKYITHLLYNSNDASTLDLKNGVLDYSEDFVSRVWELKEFGVKTYLKEAPYYPAETLPTFYINVHRPGLSNVDVRRALAYAINYPDITDKAMNGYSDIIDPSLLVFDYEKSLLDNSKTKDLAWSYDPDKANAILDSIGAIKGADGIRVLPDGTRLGPWNLECPAGWTDWNATIDIAVQNAKAVGIELVSSFVEWNIYDSNKSTGNFDLSMDTPAAYPTPNGLYRRAYALLDSSDMQPIGETAFWNYGRYENLRANELLKAIGATSDQAKLKDLITELNVIYLTDVPTIPLYYRPVVFYTFNEGVWGNFPCEENGTDLPPALFEGTGYFGLFKLETK